MEIEHDDDDENLICKNEEDLLTVSMMKLYSSQDAFKIGNISIHHRFRLYG
ncbi:hypothetical protein Hanom_Chr05g00469851 [Helianthus anomalus]